MSPSLDGITSVVGGLGSLVIALGVLLGALTTLLGAMPTFRASLERFLGRKSRPKADDRSNSLIIVGLVIMLACGGLAGFGYAQRTAAPVATNFISLESRSGSVSAVAFDQFTPNTLVSGGADGQVRVWNTSNGQAIRRFDTHAGNVTTIAFSKLKVNALAVGTASGVIQIWDPSSGTRINSLTTPNGIKISAVKFDPYEMNTLLSSSGRGLQVWDASTGSKVRQRMKAASDVTSIEFSVLGRNTLASGSTDGTVQIWDPSRSQLKHTLGAGGGGSPITALAFDPFIQNTLAAGSADGTVRFWDYSQNRVIRTLHSNTEGIDALAFNPLIRNSLAVAGVNDHIEILDAQSGLPDYTLDGQPDVTCLRYSPDGRLLASSSSYGTIRLWQIKPS